MTWEYMKYQEMLKVNGRFLLIFSTKSLIWTGITTLIGLIFFALFRKIGLNIIGLIILGIFAVAGFIIGTCKMPKIDSLKVTRHTAGEDLDDIIIRAIKFKLKKNRIYVYAKEEKNDDSK